MLKADLQTHRRNVNPEMLPLLLDYHARELKHSTGKTFFLYFVHEIEPESLYRFCYVEDSHKVWGMREADLMRKQGYKEYIIPADESRKD